MTPEILSRTDEMKAAIREEHLRLLYVAATRAEKWLIVAMAGKPGKDGSGWYDIVLDAMGHLPKEKLEGGKLRFEAGDWDMLPIQEARNDVIREPSLDSDFRTVPPQQIVPSEILSPSDLGGPKALPGDEGWDRDTAKAYGTLVHQLVERLPDLTESATQEVSRSLSFGVDDDTATKALAEARSVIEAPGLAAFFALGTLGEVPVSGVYNSRRLHGSIDRLIFTPDRIIALDFKTNRVIPDHPGDCPEGILRQMGAYLHLLRQIYPGTMIEVGIVWTGSASYMPLPDALVLEALTRAPDLDDDQAAT